MEELNRVSEMEESNLVSGIELSRQIFELEQIRVVILAHPGELFRPYPFNKCSGFTNRVYDVLERRLRPILGETQYVVVSGTGEVNPHGRSTMGTIRGTYY
ncbi:hypothetical protein F9L16_09895 [Agarivorans sp. B2Z047]|uniref:hypothetical protein n=1 Tax=Agarivorans sp. B2Z047 TaxID=2652721 RepID=UPI00128CC14B|nr:hypothetical protein [Agarivorans sp. B2Z047]MPW29310.1 hypothetical protein [Agarivorans sp. B2Z047]UQN44897.1 hypothetical protein LQZ07_10660 [Agarivorans sp. B2Z047]